MILPLETLQILNYPDVLMRPIALDFERGQAQWHMHTVHPGTRLPHPMNRDHVAFYRRLSERSELSADTRDFIRKVVSLFDGA